MILESRCASALFLEQERSFIKTIFLDSLLWDGIFMESHIRYISYGKKEKEIIKKGITAIQEVLMGDNADEKRSLLLALDWFMDPYYKQDVYIADMREELNKLLQTVIITSDEDEVSEDALELLSSYEWPPFEIFEKNLDKVSKILKPYVLYVINMGEEE